MDESRLNFLSTDNSIDNINDAISNDTTSTVTRIDWKNQAIIGNFMPAIIKMENKEIHPDEIVDKSKESRLIHLATYYSYVNVVRTLIEVYKSNISVKNVYGHTPLHIICNNNRADSFLFSYFIKNDMIDINETDKTNVTPIFYAVMSKFNIGFMTLVDMGANIRHTDIYGNNILYIAMANNNKFALKFLLSNFDLNINKKFYNDTVSLADLFISNKDNSCLRYLIKYYYNEININSIYSCKKPANSFNFVNNFNYELLNTFYNLKSKDYMKLFKLHFNLYNLQISLYLIIKNMKRIYKIIFLWMYLLCLISFYMYLDNLISIKFDISYTVKIIRQLAVIGLIAYSLIWTFNIHK
jgi:hypothetical protein